MLLEKKKTNKEGSVGELTHFVNNTELKRKTDPTGRFSKEAPN